MVWETAASQGSGGWDWVLFWTVVGALSGSLALVGVVITFFAYRRQFPKRRLAFGYDARSLLRSHALLRDELEVRLRGNLLREPHFVELEVWSESRADIPSASFDGQRAITFDVVADLVVPGWSSGEIDLDVGRYATGPGLRVTVPPQLIRKDDRILVTFVSDGEPTIEPKSSLIDIPLTLKYDSSRKDKRLSAWTIYGRMLRNRWIQFFLVVYVVAAIIVSFSFALSSPR